eukprot:6337207-Pyramimonas_sp.AAC.1
MNPPPRHFPAPPSVLRAPFGPPPPSSFGLGLPFLPPPPPQVSSSPSSSSFISSGIARDAGLIHWPCRHHANSTIWLRRRRVRGCWAPQ